MRRERCRSPRLRPRGFSQINPRKVAPSATAERDLWRDSHAKAELPFCATAEQVARLSIRVLPECDAERAKLAASAP